MSTAAVALADGREIVLQLPPGPGVGADGEDGTNELTYLFLEAANLSRAVTNVTVRIHPNTPSYCSSATLT